jgi:carboxypeptidase Q
VKKILFPVLIVMITWQASAQDVQKIIGSIFNSALTDRSAYNNLEYLCKHAGGRLAGSQASVRAIEYTREALLRAGADTVWLQEVTVPHWVRGYERCTISSAVNGSKNLSIAALGLSAGTDTLGISAGVLEVQSINELKNLDKSKIEGKIVFFNRPVDNTLVNTFSGYGNAVDQRISGASEASRFGAIAVIVRSVTQFIDDYPHTGVTHYEGGVKKIPAIAVSTMGADLLSNWLKSDPSLMVHMVSTCTTLPDTVSWNVIGELRGTSKKNEFITVGGHLDSWDITEGAHDDAGGCVQSIEVLRLLKSTGTRISRSVRAVMFMNEEMSASGGREYADIAAEKGELHYAAIESDRGVMSPRGFGFDAEGSRLKRLKSLSKYFLPYNIRDFDKGGSGADVGPLKELGTLQIGYIPDIQRYFAYHHSVNDTFEQVNIRELQLGSAAIASLVYLLDHFNY